MKLTAAELAEFERQVAAHPAAPPRKPGEVVLSYATLIAQRTAQLASARG